MNDFDWTLSENAEITVGEADEVAAAVTLEMATTFQDRGWSDPPYVSPAIVYAVFECLRRRHREKSQQ